MLFTIHSFLFIKSRFLTYILLFHIKKRGISMFVYNVKINGSKTFKVFFTGICILMVIISIIVCIRVFGGADKSSSVADGISKDTVFKISASNYTNVLKTVHDNIDTYVGKKVSFSGYIYRLLDFSDKQFVLARDMIISSDFKSVVVGVIAHKYWSKLVPKDESPSNSQLFVSNNISNSCNAASKISTIYKSSPWWGVRVCHDALC